MDQKYDYIVLGAGSAGCVLANRLSADKSNSVLLVEAGPEDNTMFIKIPMGFGVLVGSEKYAWHYRTKTFGKANIYEEWARGKTLGGSSAINGMVYNRGTQPDWDGLAAAGGADDFAWKHIVEHYKKIEDNRLGATLTRGKGGPLGIGPVSDPDPLMEAVVEAGTKAGLKRLVDVNESDEERIGHAMCNIKNGQRVSAAHAFLEPVQNRDNLTIVTETVAEKLIFKGNRVIGVQVSRKGKREEIFAKKEVILSLGGIKSPKILMNSGIGPAEVLKKAGVEVRLDQQHIGRHLVEHRNLILKYRLKENLGMNRHINNPLAQAVSGLKYFICGKKGIMAKPAYQVMGFCKSTPEKERVDAQMLLSPFTVNEYAPGQSPTIEKWGGVQAIGYPLRPTSEGYLEITGKDVHSELYIDPNYCATNHDKDILINLYSRLRNLFATQPIAEYLDHETLPGVDMVSPEDLINLVVDKGFCGYHAISTCRMGPDDNDPVDGKLRLRGFEGIRIMDCSILPTMVSGNGNGPMMAMASRAAEIILYDK